MKSTLVIDPFQYGPGLKTLFGDDCNYITCYHVVVKGEIFYHDRKQFKDTYGFQKFFFRTCYL